jgi:hypothetical protein
MDTWLFRVNRPRRLAYTLAGLVAGDVLLLFFLVQRALHATVLAGEPMSMISDTLQMFIIYAIFSFVGWVLAGLPIALIFSADHIARLSWLSAVIAGAILGPTALLVIFVLLGCGHIYFHDFSETSTLYAYSILVSTVSFVVYLALIRRDRKNQISLETRPVGLG